MKKYAALLLLCLAPFAGALEGKYAFNVGETRVGTAVLTLNKLADGGAQFQVDLKVESQGFTMHQRQEDRYDKNSRPVLSTTTVKQSGKSKETKLEFGKDALTVTVVEDGKKKVKTVAYPKGKSLLKPSQVWFFVSTPMPGAVSKEIEYNGDTGKWVSRDRKYVGRVDLEFGGKTIKAYELHDVERGTDNVVKQWVDGQGLPYRVEFTKDGQTMTLDRIAE
jgi:hypothetical protein